MSDNCKHGILIGFDCPHCIEDLLEMERADNAHYRKRIIELEREVVKWKEIAEDAAVAQTKQEACEIIDKELTGDGLGAVTRRMTDAEKYKKLCQDQLHVNSLLRDSIREAENDLKEAEIITNRMEKAAGRIEEKYEWLWANCHIYYFPPMSKSKRSINHSLDNDVDGRKAIEEFMK